jgi:hypothetical protein
MVVGWHGSSERNLRAIARAWQSLDDRLVTDTVVPDTWRGMSRPGGWNEVGRELAERLVASHRSDPRPWILHSFSNAGFWTSLAMLEALRADHPEVHAALHAALIDSAPGFPEHVDPGFTAKYAAMAMAPSLLAAMGRKPRHQHWLLTPPLEAFLRFWHHVAPKQIRFMETSQARMSALLKDTSIEALYGDADELVPYRFVEGFIDGCRREGLAVHAERFEGSGHVRHFAGARTRYSSRMREALAIASRDRGAGSRG